MIVHQPDREFEPGKTAALVVVHDKALQRVVDLVEPELQLQRGVAVDAGLMLEVADAGVEKDDLLDRQRTFGGLADRSEDAAVVINDAQQRQSKSNRSGRTSGHFDSSMGPPYSPTTYR
jgi:hypothetical protein